MPHKISQSSLPNESAKPFLRWSGGKRRSLARLLQLKPNEYKTYHEPFIGGGCLFFALSTSNAYISDINPEVVRTYRAIQNNPEDVANYLQSIPHTRQAFEQLRNLSPSECDDTQAAARLIFLMKSCFNGVYRENKSGRFNTPWGGKVFKIPDLHELLAIQKKLAGTNIECNDFEKVLDHSQINDFIYLDPPYPQNRHRGEFGKNFTENDVARFVDVCKKLDKGGVKVMISYVIDENIAHNLKGWRTEEVNPSRSVASNNSFRGTSRELIYTNF